MGNDKRGGTDSSNKGGGKRDDFRESVREIRQPARHEEPKQDRKHDNTNSTGPKSPPDKKG